MHIKLADLEFNILAFRTNDLKSVLNDLNDTDMKLLLLRTTFKKLKSLINSYENGIKSFRLIDKYSYEINTKYDDLIFKEDFDLSFALCMHYQITEQLIKDHIASRIKFFKLTQEWIHNEILLLKKNRVKKIKYGKIILEL